MLFIELFQELSYLSHDVVSRSGNSTVQIGINFQTIRFCLLHCFSAFTDDIWLLLTVGVV